jgi:glutamate mutase epsilon subunit
MCDHICSEVFDIHRKHEHKRGGYEARTKNFNLVVHLIIGKKDGRSLEGR